MITTNGADIFLMYITRESIVSGTIKDTSGNLNTTNIGATTFNFTQIYTGGVAGMSLHFGSGDTAESVDDYCLAADFGIYPTVSSCGKDDASWVITASSRNSTGASITINEIGVIACTGLGSTHQEFLIARKVVPERVVENGETFTYTYAIDIAQLGG